MTRIKKVLGIEDKKIEASSFDVKCPNCKNNSDVQLYGSQKTHTKELDTLVLSARCIRCGCYFEIRQYRKE